MKNELRDKNYPTFEPMPFTKGNDKEALRRVEICCNYKNYTFNGFCDKDGNDCEWLGVHKTFLKLHCNTCNHDWNTTNYKNFIISQNGCPKCKYNIVSQKKALTEEIVQTKIQNRCQESNYTFKGFCDKDGNNTINNTINIIMYVI